MANVKSRLDEALTEQSKYCYPNTDVLINKLGITNQEDLDIAERRITTLMLMDLQTTPLPKPGTFFTPEYYFSLHKKIFEHIYSFAGETRNENITKGNTPFCRPEYLYSYMRQTFDDLAHKLVKIKDKEDILDYMGSTELAANLFRITQTDEVLKNRHVDNEDDACKTHHAVGQAVRQTIKKIGGTMPEKLPTPEKSIKELEKEELKKIEN